MCLRCSRHLSLVCPVSPSLMDLAKTVYFVSQLANCPVSSTQEESDTHQVHLNVDLSVEQLRHSLEDDLVDTGRFNLQGLRLQVTFGKLTCSQVQAAAHHEKGSWPVQFGQCK